MFGPRQFPLTIACHRPLKRLNLLWSKLPMKRRGNTKIHILNLRSLCPIKIPYCYYMLNLRKIHLSDLDKKKKKNWISTCCLHISCEKGTILLFSQKNFGTAKHKCLLLGLLVCCKYASVMRAFGSVFRVHYVMHNGPVTSTCVSHWQSSPGWMLIRKWKLCLLNPFEFGNGNFVDCFYHICVQFMVVLFDMSHMQIGYILNKDAYVNNFCGHLR